MTWTKLHDACENQHTPEIVRLVRSEPEQVLRLDDHGSTPLHILCWGDPDPNAVQALLDACPQTVSGQDYHGDTPLHIACSCAKTGKRVVQLLLDTCPEAVSITNREGLQPLHMACRYAPENEAVIGLLIEAYPYALRTRIKVRSSNRVAVFGSSISCNIVS